MEVKVSIIIPNYNHAPYLRQRIESVLNQTYQDFEIILLDDASTDGSLEVLDAYKTHPKVKHLIVNAENSGSPFIQWKKGIELARGEFIWIAESDDFADINFLNKTVGVLESKPKNILVYTNSEIVDDKNNSLGYWSDIKNDFFNTDRWDKDYVNNGIREIVQYLFYKTTINNVSAVLFRKINLVDLGFLNDLISYSSAGDLYTYIFMALKGNIAYISKSLNFYREHKFNVTKNNMSGANMYNERVHSYTYALKKILVNKEAISFKDDINSSAKYIILKNGFKLIDLDQKKILFDFIRWATQTNIFNWRIGFTYRILFNIYGLRLYKVSGFCKMILKHKLNQN